MLAAVACASAAGLSRRKRRWGTRSSRIASRAISGGGEVFAAWGLVCVPAGERMAVWSRSTGELTQYDGPRRFLTFGAQVKKLLLYSAAPDEYIEVAFKDGRVDRLQGPSSLWEDPLEHSSVRIIPATRVGTNEAIVIYWEERAANNEATIHRRVLEGPAVHVPSGLEWLHSFCWHGTDPKSLSEPVQRKLPGILRFEKLRLCPDQLYFDAPNVRTSDDALVTVQVMLFMQLNDVERMLDTTHDPISDFINALSADIVAFVGARSFEEFKHGISELSDLATYKNVRSRAEAIGYGVSRIIFRGYLSSEQLQLMHDEAIQKRTRLVLEQETEEQAQKLEDFKLEQEQARERLRQAAQEETAANEERIRDVQAKASLARSLQEHLQTLDMRGRELAQERENKTEQNVLAQAHCDNLKGMGVDVSRYMVASVQPAAKVIQVDGASDGKSAAPVVHVHED